MVHVLPIDDVRVHELTADCGCGPCVEWCGEDGMPYGNGPMVVHNSFDEREFDEWDGKSAAPGKEWIALDLDE